MFGWSLVARQGFQDHRMRWDHRWALVKTDAQCRVSPELKLGQSGLWAAWASLISVSYSLPRTMAWLHLLPHLWAGTGHVLGGVWAHPLSPSSQDSSPRPTPPLVSSLGGGAQNWMQCSQHGLENSECVTNISVTRNAQAQKRNSHQLI